MQPHEVIKQAVKGHVGGVALRMGKSDQYIYKMMAEPESCRYTRFLQAFLAIYAENSIGGDSIAEDFNAIWRSCREGRESSAVAVDWFEAVAKTVEETSEAISEAVVNRDPARIELEIVEAIAALRGLRRVARARNEREPLKMAVGGQS